MGTHQESVAASRLGNKGTGTQGNRDTGTQKHRNTKTNQHQAKHQNDDGHKPKARRQQPRPDTPSQHFENSSGQGALEQQTPSTSTSHKAQVESQQPEHTTKRKPNHTHELFFRGGGRLANCATFKKAIQQPGLATKAQRHKGTETQGHRSTEAHRQTSTKPKPTGDNTKRNTDTDNQAKDKDKDTQT